MALTTLAFTDSNVLKAADGVMNLTSSLRGNPSNFTLAQYPYRQTDPSDLNKTPQRLFPNDTNTNTAGEATEWSFNPQKIKIPSDPRESHTRNDWKYWDDDSGLSWYRQLEL